MSKTKRFKSMVQKFMLKVREWALGLSNPVEYGDFCVVYISETNFDVHPAGETFFYEVTDHRGHAEELMRTVSRDAKWDGDGVRQLLERLVPDVSITKITIIEDYLV